MPVVKGGNTSHIVGGSYNVNPLTEYAQRWLELAQNVQNEATVDIFEEPLKVMRKPEARESFKEFFVNDTLDEAAIHKDPLLNDLTIEDEKAMNEQQFDNNVHAIFENAAQADYNPVIGLAFPIQKNILMNMVFDKGAIQKVVADQPKFTLSMEERILVDSKGNEIDMFLDQDKMTPAIDASNPVVQIDINLPESGATDVLKQCGGTIHDDLSITTHVAYVKLTDLYAAVGDKLPDENGVIGEKSKIADEDSAGPIAEAWFPVNLEFKPGYNQYERSFVEPLTFQIRKADGTLETRADSISGTMDHNKFNIYSAQGIVKAVRLAAQLDTANAMVDTCSVKWHATTSLIEIPNNIPINVPISPEEVKDLAALYQVNQLTKIMSLIKTTLANYKDDKIKEFLEDDYTRLPERCKYENTYDMAPPTGYALDYVEWRYKTFFDQMDSEVQRLLYVLNDPDMTITVFGDPDLIRKITPTEYSYQTPASIGPVTLDYKRTVVTSDRRVYQFIGSDKLRNRDNLIIILTPRNSDRVTYRIYDYQLYISNEIRNINNPALPAIHAFERWKIVSYQGVQGRTHIKNRSGMRPVTEP